MKIKFFDLAKRIASKSDHHLHKLGCVIVKKNRIISMGWNEMKTHSKSNHPWKFVHAEFKAILNVDPEELKGSTAYIYREHKDGSPALSKPCPHCLHALESVGIKKICYSTYGAYHEEKL